MAVYVDDAQIPYGTMVMCHMTADSHAELMAMAARIGVQLKWIQHAGTWSEHFDIALSKRRLAIAAGAVPVTKREIVTKLREKRSTVLHSARSPQDGS